MVEFQGRQYTLNQQQATNEADNLLAIGAITSVEHEQTQTEGGLLQFIDKSKPGEYTRYYDKIIFHTERNGFIAAYANDLNNFWNI